MTNNDQWESEIEMLKTIIAKTELVETNKWGGYVYVDNNNRNIVGVGGFKNYFTLWFYNGAFLNDEKKHLINANEGVTKALRQWRFTSKEQINEKEIVAYLLEAIENEKQGKILKPEKTKGEIVIPLLLKNKLEADSELQLAFSKFSPYKQREFIEHIESAKREETKISRIEKIVPMILNNVGLNDKYR